MFFKLFLLDQVFTPKKCEYGNVKTEEHQEYAEKTVAQEPSVPQQGEDPE